MANIWNPYRFAYSEYVVPLLCLSLILIGVIIRWLIEGRKRNEYIWRLLLMFWIFTILSATILGRGRYRGDNLNLHLFWTFR
ncbi:VanZ family protein, partial [Anaerotignum faecicola]|nr:VanZ family protein [Anaerotignum faecicola]